MSAREDILGRVRDALAGVETGTDVPPAPRIAAPADIEQVVAHFADRVADYRAVVERCAPDELAQRVAAALHDGARVVVPAGLDLEVPGAVVDDGFTATELDRFDAVVTRASAGIAETGTIVLDHGPGQGRRAITLVPDLHVCIVRSDQVVPDVPDAMPVLATSIRKGRPLTWISGPSATSDIELDRVEGVHGPRTLHVLLVG